MRELGKNGDNQISINGTSSLLHHVKPDRLLLEN